MKTKMAILIISVIIAVTILPSCSSTPLSYNVEISCDQFNENSNYVVSETVVDVGDKFILKLCSNITTGFEWEYVMTSDDVVKVADHSFEEPEGDMPGAAGVEVWTFEAVEKGTTEIQMEYSQPWEGGIKGEWTCTTIITVN